jgi:diguanylate cyclase (GGDEF)-like protein/PAS domain S-box-containing protein
MANVLGIRAGTWLPAMNAAIPAGSPDPATNLLIGQKEIIEGIVAGRDLHELLTAICELVEAQTENMLCSVLLLDSEGIHVRHGAAPSLPAAFVRSIDGSAIGPTAGSCGTAAYHGKAVIVEDIATDPLWNDYRHLALPHGLQACWSTPVFDPQRRVLGTFAIYYRQPRKPAPEHAALIEMATQTAAIAIEHHRTIEKLSVSEERFKLVSKATNDAVWDWDFAQNTIWWNDGFTSLFGYPREELEPGPESWTLRIHPDEVQQVADDIHHVIDGSEQYWSAEYRFRRKDGSYADIFDRGFVIRDAAGKAIRMIGAMQDISQRKQAEIKIRRLNRVYAVLSGINTLIVRVHDRQQLFSEACRIATEQGGFGMAWIGLLDPATRDVIPAAWSGAADNDEWAMLKASARDDDEGRGTIGTAVRTRQPVIINDIPARLDINSRRRGMAVARGMLSAIALPLLVENEVAGAFVLLAREAGFFDEEEVRLLTELAGDISFALQYIAKEEKANYLAYYDVVTGLPNRTLFLEHLSHALHTAGDNAGKFVLVLGDIKRFRMINDTLGRQAGDEVLRQVGAHLLRVIRNPENLARVTSDCFATFLPGFIDPVEMSHRIERFVTEILRNPVKIAGRELTLAFAMGISVYPDDGTDAETLFRNAETALKKAKAGGESYLFYAPEMNARAAESLTLENKLRRALELGQFVLHYQPKVDVRTRALTGLEALIRWQDPELGLVPPAQFIPLMEETGLILEVGQWALRQAVTDHRNWTARGLRPPRIAVNASSIQLRQKNFIDTVIDAVSGFGGADVALDIEITESVMMENLGDMTKVLQVISGLGVHIAMDDFGTGYSSLSYIAKLPINELKIDRSFVIEMASSEYSRNIVTMIIQLAHTLHFKVVAEGVDAEEQLRILEQLGCDQMQGYLISKPLPPAEIEQLLRKSRAP